MKEAANNTAAFGPMTKPGGYRAWQIQDFSKWGCKSATSESDNRFWSHHCRSADGKYSSKIKFQLLACRRPYDQCSPSPDSKYGLKKCGYGDRWGPPRPWIRHWSWMCSLIINWATPGRTEVSFFLLGKLRPSTDMSGLRFYVIPNQSARRWA